jgi:hypothetical protein
MLDEQPTSMDWTASYSSTADEEEVVSPPPPPPSPTAAALLDAVCVANAGVVHTTLADGTLFVGFAATTLAAAADAVGLVPPAGATRNAQMTALLDNVAGPFGPVVVFSLWRGSSASSHVSACEMALTALAQRPVVAAIVVRGIEPAYAVGRGFFVLGAEQAVASAKQLRAPAPLTPWPPTGGVTNDALVLLSPLGRAATLVGSVLDKLAWHKETLPTQRDALDRMKLVVHQTLLVLAENMAARNGDIFLGVDTEDDASGMRVALDVQPSCSAACAVVAVLDVRPPAALRADERMQAGAGVAAYALLRFLCWHCDLTGGRLVMRPETYAAATRLDKDPVRRGVRDSLQALFAGPLQQFERRFSTTDNGLILYV